MVAAPYLEHVPEWLVEDDLVGGRLRRVLPAWSSDPIPAWAVHRRELRGAAKLRAFLEALPRVAPARTIS
jgi:DNA-binding transcriptional LysR family regulator